MQRSTGAIISQPDYRDQLAARAVFDAIAAAGPTLPASFTTDLSKLGDLLDQNKIPACVSHAWALVMKYWWWKKTGELVDFSPRFLDILSAESFIPIDGGRIPRTVCKVSVRYGCCTTKLLPNNTDTLTIGQYRDKSVITQAMYDEAKKYRTPGYIRIPDDMVSDFRTAVYQFGLVSGLFAISDNFWKPSWSSADINPLRTATPTSNHMMVVYGWKDALLNTLRNSWSKLWNVGGDGDYDASKWLPYIFEGWAIAELPKDIGAWLSSLPAQADFHYELNKDLKRGDVNDDVKFMQIGLMILGYLDPVAPADLGIYGPRTSKAVLKFQAARGIYPTAPDNFGQRSRAAFNKDFSL